MSKVSATGQKGAQNSSSTLGDVLYATLKPNVLERDWAALVQSIASGDEPALHALYGMSHRFVFTLAMRITANRETAEEVTLDVFHDVWRRASSYDPANGTVLGWIMNQARSRAIDRLRFDGRKKRSNVGDEQPLAEVVADPHDVLELREQGEALREALAGLTPDEREAMLVPGDYNYGAPGAEDHRVWSETGCTCVLVTSTRDTLHGSAATG